MKKLLGTQPGHKHYDSWIADNNPQHVRVMPKNKWDKEELEEAIDLEKANKVVVGLNSVQGQVFSATELASTTFNSIRRVMQEYQKEHGGYDSGAIPEAYLVIPPDFDAAQRSTIILAAKRAGIEVVKLIEEPIAAIYGVRRLENFGWYSVTDFGDTLKHYMVRVFDGEADLCEETYVEMPQILSNAERAFYEYLVRRLPVTKHIRPWKNEFVKLFDAARDCLIDGPEYVIPQSSSWMHRTLPYISREARQLASFFAVRESAIDTTIAGAIGKVLPSLNAVTHPVLIGGNSMAYPEVATILENTFETRLSDTITTPAASLALGAAMKAAEDIGYTKSILRGRDVSPFGHSILASSYVDTMHHHIHLSKHHVPLASTINYSTISAYGTVEPLLPAFHEEQLLEENVSKPYPALSYAHIRDPFSGELEHWARISIQTPRPPKKGITDEEAMFDKEAPLPRWLVLDDPVPDWIAREWLLDGEPDLEDIQPDLSLAFVLNLTASPLYDTSKNIDIDPAKRALALEADENSTLHRNSPAFAKIISDNPDRPQYKLVDSEAFVPEHIRRDFQENMVDILEMIQKQKDSHSGFYRIQNRAFDTVQSIAAQLRPNDHYAIMATGGMAQTPLLSRFKVNQPLRQMGSASQLTSFQKVKTADHEAALDTIRTADITGRASSKLLDAITLAHESFLQHIEECNKAMETELKTDISDMEQAIDDWTGPDGQPKNWANRVLTDDPNDLPRLPGGASDDPADWKYPGMTPDILYTWYSLYQMMKYELTEEGAKELDEEFKEIPAEDKPEKKDMDAAWDEIVAEAAPTGYISVHQRESDMLKTRGDLKFLKGLMERLDARKTLKALYGHQHRMVIITDAQPDSEQLKEIEAALQRASRDNISVTFLSIDGSPFDGPFHQMVGRVKGAKIHRMYRRHLWNHSYLEEYGDNTNAWHNAFNEDSLKNLAVKVDFPGYTIDKVYGGLMTPEEKARLEMQKTTSTIRFKMGSLTPSYDIVPSPTPLTGDGTTMLVKLKPKQGANDEMRATDPDWLYDPESKTDQKALTVGSRLKPSAHTPITFDITWNDRQGKKLNEQIVLRLTDFNAPAGYFDEPGIARLVRNAKFTEFVRKMLHIPFQDKLSFFDSDTPILEADDEKSGIQFLGQKQENQLVRIYDESRQSVIRMANERLLGSPENNYGSGPIPEKYHKLFAIAAHLFDLSAVRFQGDFTSSYYNPNSDIVARILKSYMDVSGIAPISLFARWKSSLDSMRESIRNSRLESPQYDPSTLEQTSMTTLATFVGNAEKDKSLPLPPKVRVPKFHGLALSPEEKIPALDRRNSIINAKRMDDLNLFPRNEMAPVDPSALWYSNTLLIGGDDSFAAAESYIELRHRGDLPLEPAPPIGMPDPRALVREVVGPENWPDYERALDLRDRMADRAARGLPIPQDPTIVGFETADMELARLFSNITDENFWIDMLTKMAAKENRAKRLYEKNAILGPQRVPISELRRYYNEVVAPHQSPEEIDKANKIFKKIEKRNAKGEKKLKRDAALFDEWYELLQKERSYPNSVQQYALNLIERARQEDIDEAERNYAFGQLDSLEQQAIDSNSVLLKHLVENRDILNQIRENLGTEDAKDEDIVKELEKHLPEGFLESALSTVQRVVVPDGRGIHPSQVDEARKIGSADEAYEAEQIEAGYSPSLSRTQEEIDREQKRQLYSKLFVEAIPTYKHAMEFGADLSVRDPIEVHLSNIPIDWEDRFHRLTRKAKAAIRSRLLREGEEKREMRDRLRTEMTKIAQRRVDHRLFLTRVHLQMEELELQMSELPYVDPEEYQKRLNRLKMDIDPTEYTLLVYAEYGRVAEHELGHYFVNMTVGRDALVPFSPRASAKLIDVLEKYHFMTPSTASRYRDPLGYWFGKDDPQEDFFETRLSITEQNPHMGTANNIKRIIYEGQVAREQSKAASGASEVHTEPEEGGLTVSTGEGAFSETTADEGEGVQSDIASKVDESISNTSEINPESNQTASQLDTNANEGEGVKIGEKSENSDEVSKNSEEVSKNSAEEEISGNEDTVEIGGDVDEPDVPIAPVYGEWKKILKDPWTRDDFRTGLDYHIYKTQSALDPLPRDPEILSSKQAEVSFDILEFLNPDGTIDWNHVKTRRLQYPVLPPPREVGLSINNQYDNTDNTGRELLADDFNEREVTKAEIEAINQFDIDTMAGFEQTHSTLDDIRVRIAEETRLKELVAANAKKYEIFSQSTIPTGAFLASSLASNRAAKKVVEADGEGFEDVDDEASYSQPSNVSGVVRTYGHLHPALDYDPLRDGWDQDRHDEYMGRAYDIFRAKMNEIEGNYASEARKLEQHYRDEVYAEMVKRIMVLPGSEEKSIVEEVVSLDQAQREMAYSPPEDPRKLWSETAHRDWIESDKAAFRGEFEPYFNWVSLKLFDGAIKIPFWPTFGVHSPIEQSLPSFRRLRLDPKTPMERFEPKEESILTIETMPAPTKPRYQNPNVKRENAVFDQLRALPLDRYMQATRKAFEKFHGLAYSKNKERLRADWLADYEKYKERQALDGAGISRVVSPLNDSQKDVVSSPISSDAERIAEAARLTRLGLAKIGQEISDPNSSSGEQLSESSHTQLQSTSSSKPAIPIQKSIDDFTSPVPGSFTSRVPTTLRERWEHAKQQALDMMVREHSLEHEKENFERWKEERKAQGAKQIGAEIVSPPSLVKYPQYEDISVKGPLFGLPSVSVTKVLRSMAKESKERYKVAKNVLKADLRKAYRDCVADTNRVRETMRYLNTEYDSLARARIRRTESPVIPEDWESLAEPNLNAGEEFHSQIQEPIDFDLARQVFQDLKVPGAAPDFWDLKDTKPRRQQKKLNDMLTRGTPEQIALWEKKMEEIYERKWKFAAMIEKRRQEIGAKMLRIEARAVLSPALVDELEMTNFFEGQEQQVRIGSLEDLDLRVKFPNASWEPTPYDRRHLADLENSRYPNIRERLEKMVQESIRAQRAASGLPEDEPQEEEHGHGHGHH